MTVASEGRPKVEMRPMQEQLQRKNGVEVRMELDLHRMGIEYTVSDYRLLFQNILCLGEKQ